MQISSVLNGLSDATITGKRPEPALAAGAKYSAAAATSGAAGEGQRASRLGQILAQHNVTHITPAEFSAMLQQLRESGAMDDAQLQELAQIRRDLDQAGKDPDEVVNLLRFYAERTEQLQQQQQVLGNGIAAEAAQKATQNELAAVGRRRQWVEKLAAMHEASDAVGLDLAG